MSSADNMMTIHAVSSKLGLSVHQLRRWELMFGLDIKRGRGQQRQYRPEDLMILERIRELLDDGWSATNVRSQLELEGLITPRLIGLPSSGDQGDLIELMAGFRSFCERRFLDMADQIDELRQLVLSLSLQQGLQSTPSSPWRPINYGEPAAPPPPPEEIAIGPTAVTPKAKSSNKLPEVPDQNYLSTLGKALDLVGWSDAQADEYSAQNFGVPVWIDLNKTQAGQFINHLKALLPQS